MMILFLLKVEIERQGRFFGMLPVAQGTAIGLERLAPLGAVAIGGLVVGTLMTLIFIPVGFVWLVDEKSVISDD